MRTCCLPWGNKTLSPTTRANRHVLIWWSGSKTVLTRSQFHHVNRRTQSGPMIPPLTSVENWTSHVSIYCAFILVLPTLCFLSPCGLLTIVKLQDWFGPVAHRPWAGSVVRPWLPSQHIHEKDVERWELSYNYQQDSQTNLRKEHMGKRCFLSFWSSWSIHSPLGFPCCLMYGAEVFSQAHQGLWHLKQLKQLHRNLLNMIYQ